MYVNVFETKENKNQTQGKIEQQHIVTCMATRVVFRCGNVW